MPVFILSRIQYAVIPIGLGIFRAYHVGAERSKIVPRPTIDRTSPHPSWRRKVTITEAKPRLVPRSLDLVV